MRHRAINRGAAGPLGAMTDEKSLVFLSTSKISSKPVTGNKKLETKGKVDQVKGAVHNAVGDARDAGKEAIESVRNAPSKR